MELLRGGEPPLEWLLGEQIVATVDDPLPDSLRFLDLRVTDSVLDAAEELLLIQPLEIANDAASVALVMR